MNPTDKNRRSFLIGSAGLGSAFLASTSSDVLAAGQCLITPKQTAGPFYPGESKFSKDFDLTRLPGHAQKARGQVVYINGQILDEDCNPVEGATVEVWQACHSGKYNNQKDPNPAPLDPHFRYWSEAITGANGQYAFKTIVPGAYPADKDWMRPPHIHYRVTKLGFRELVTQMYFAGNAFNDADLILKAIPASERGSVIVDFVPSPADLEPGSQVGSFNLTIQKVRRS